MKQEKKNYKYWGPEAEVDKYFVKADRCSDERARIIRLEDAHLDFKKEHIEARDAQFQITSALANMIRDVRKTEKKELVLSEDDIMLLYEIAHGDKKFKLF